MPLVLCIVGQYKKRTGLELGDLRGEAFLSVWRSICEDRDESQILFHLHGDLAEVCRKNRPKNHVPRGPTFYKYKPDDLEIYFALCKTSREKSVVRFLSEGYTQREIATKLDLSPATINLIVESLRDRYYENPSISVTNVD